MLHHALRGIEKVSVGGATIAYLTNLTDTSGGTTITFTPTGTYSAGLFVVGIIAENANTTGRTLSSVTFNSNSMTSIVNTASGTGNNGSLIGALFSYKRTTLTSNPSIVVTFSGSTSRVNIGLWKINDNTSDTVFDTATSNISGTASSSSNTVNSLGVGYVGVSILANGTFAATTWTNATERYEAFSSGTGGSGADFKTTTSGDRTITATASSDSAGGQVLVTGVWG